MHPNSLKNLKLGYLHTIGKAPWNKGTKGVMNANKTSFKSGRKDDKHPEWKGENASYHAKHAWVARWRGKPKKCQFCGTIRAKVYNWANISGEYKRDLYDYIRLCRPCHHKFDNISQKLWKKRNQK